MPLKFKIGDEVTWHDPDDDICTGNYIVTDIREAELELEHMQSVVAALEHECTLVKRGAA